LLRDFLAGNNDKLSQEEGSNTGSSDDGSGKDGEGTEDNNNNETSRPLIATYLMCDINGVMPSYMGVSLSHIGLFSFLGKCMGFSYPHGSQVRVPAGMGMGSDSPTHDLQNKPKNIFLVEN